MTNTTALATRTASTEIVAWNMTRDQLTLLKRTVAQGTTDDEFALFMTTADRLGLDPFTKQIHAVKRSSYDKQQNRYVDKMAIQVGIDGFRAVADRTGENDGQDGPYWCGKDGKWTDVWLADEPPLAARLVVYKKGCAKPFTGVARYKSYVQTGKGGDPNRQWQQMPDVMLAKCAEALALRKAFPQKLSGVYAPEEMGQADNGKDTKPHRELKPANDAPEAIAAEVDEVAQLPAPADPAPNDVEREREWQSIKTDLDEAGARLSNELLKATVPRINALPKGSRVRRAALDAYRIVEKYIADKADDIPFRIVEKYIADKADDIPF